MSNSILRSQSKEFAKNIVLLCRRLKADRVESALTNQLLRSGTSVGANIHEAQYAQGKKDFISKFEIALKECNETEYWLELLFNTDSLSEEEFNTFRKSCISLRRMLVSTVTTLKNKSNHARRKILMACFLVPAAEAIVTTIAVKVMEKKERTTDVKVTSDTDTAVSAPKTSFARKLKWLRNLLWGGCALLCFEHVWHGEVVPWFPFLTAAADAADRAEMLHEMATVGVCMAVLVTLVWGVMVGVSALMEKRAKNALPNEE